MIEVNKNSIVYVICPAQVATGGPELLHQLVSVLDGLGIKANMVYLDELTFTKSKNISNISRYKDPVHDFYKHYNNSYALLNDVVDQPQNIIVTPETHSGVIYMFKRIQKVIWWLSVDNFFLKQQEKKYKLKKVLFLNKPYNFNKNEMVCHLAQSFYAINFLKDKGIKTSYIAYLSDFLGKSFLENKKKLPLKKRRNHILYNPKKGYEITSSLKKLMPEYDWVPLINMTPTEVKDLLLSSKLYIDFGMHPGKDRFPREAAICGCCVITGRKGSAHFKEDVYIDDIYKFDDPIDDIVRFKQIVKSCIEDYDSVITQFAAYRDRISKEEVRFTEDVKSIFLKEILD